MRIRKESDIAKKHNKMMGISTYLSIISLNVNSLNSPIKKHRLVDWIKKQRLD
jgi:hypothetical protein